MGNVFPLYADRLQGLAAAPETFAPLQALYAVTDGKKGAALDLAKWTLALTGVIGVGLFVGGERKLKPLLIKSAIAAIAVEGTALAAIQLQRRG
jgi:hypothetical protein